MDSNSLEDHDGMSSKNSKAKSPTIMVIHNEVMRSLFGSSIILDDIDVRQEYKGDSLSFWTVQTTGARGNAFLSFLKAHQAQLTAEYQAALQVIRVARKRARLVMDAASARNIVNRERRKDKNAVPIVMPDRARVTCEKRGCYGEAYRDNLCYDHYMIAHKKSTTGVTK